MADLPETRPLKRAPTLVPRTWRSAWVLVGLVVVSRLLFVEAGALAYLYLPGAWVQLAPGYIPPTGSFWFRALLGIWAHWDGYWYLSIARFGYAGRQAATAFFPLYPLLLRWLGSTITAGFLLSTAAFAAGLVGVYRLTAEEYSTRAAWFAVISLAYFPTSFFFNSLYPEALVLCLSVWSFYWARRRRFWWAALLAGVASAASLNGLLLAVPMAAYLWHDRRPWREWLSLVLVPGGLVAFMVQLRASFGNPLSFEAVQADWGRSFAPFFTTLWEGFQAFVRNLPLAFSPTHLFAAGEPLLAASNVWNFVFAVGAIVGVILTMRYLPRAYWTYALVVTLLPLCDPAAGTPLMSEPRFFLAAWPIFVAWGVFLSRRPRALVPYLAVSMAAGVVLVALFTTAHWVA